jgi:hypothetical protein
MNAHTQIRTPYGAQVRRDAALRDAHDRFYAAWQKLLADYEAEKNRIRRAYEHGEFA